MADEVDIIGERSAAEEAARQRARDESDPYVPPPGTAGECDLCGETFPRLINGVCARCRDKYKLP